MVQRLLAARTEKESRLALFASWLIILFQFTLFLVIGAILFVYYSDQNLPKPAHVDRIYPEFVWNNLPPGVAGLVIAAILAAAMSNLSAALNALASTTIMDFYKPMSSGKHSEKHFLKLARISTLTWGGILFLVGLVARNVSSVLEAGLSIASVLYGGLLGVFLLGLLTKRVGERAAITGMVAGLATMYFVKMYTSIAWTWYVLIGTSVTFSMGCLASIFLKEKSID
jgi:Na+/proline symporter